MGKVIQNLPHIGNCYHPPDHLNFDENGSHDFLQDSHKTSRDALVLSYTRLRFSCFPKLQKYQEKDLVSTPSVRFDAARIDITVEHPILFRPGYAPKLKLS